MQTPVRKVTDRTWSRNLLTERRQLYKHVTVLPANWISVHFWRISFYSFHFLLFYQPLLLFFLFGRCRLVLTMVEPTTASPTPILRLGQGQRGSGVKQTQADVTGGQSKTHNVFLGKSWPGALLLCLLMQVCVLWNRKWWMTSEPWEDGCRHPLYTTLPHVPEAAGHTAAWISTFCLTLCSSQKPCW